MIFSMIYDKKGRLGDQVAISAFLFLLFVIAGGIAVGIYIFYGDEYDFRPLEAEILNYNIRQCIFEKGNALNWNDEDEFYALCGLNKEVIKGNDIIQIKIDGRETFSANEGKVESCKLTGARKNINYPKCVIKEFDSEGKKYELITGSFQKARRLND